MPIRTFFPSSALQTSLRFQGQSIARKNREILDEIYKIQKIDDVGRKWCEKNYPGGYTTYSSFNELQKFSSTFSEIQKLIDGEVKKFAKYLEMDLGRGKLVMSNFWANIMPTGVVHTMHIHPLSVISGTYYVRTPANCSSLKFEDPRMGFFMASPPRQPKARSDNQRFISLKPKAGDLILFESWMRHEVPPNPSKEERVSISFNYDWV